MDKFFNSKLDKEIVVIKPGEYFTTDKDLIIQTLLGSCISVCLFSEVDDFVGMNHFMLSESVLSESFFNSMPGRYGMYAMEVLVASFIKRGISMNQLKAKVFGGGNILNMKKSNDTVSSSNIKFIISFLNRENIPIISSHLGGNKGRKILFYSKNKKVLMKEISKTELKNVIDEEISYNKKIIDDSKKSRMILLD